MPDSFEAAMLAVIDGDADRQRKMLVDDHGLATATFSRKHNATLLHCVGANSIENGNQRTLPNAPEICRILLEATPESQTSLQRLPSRISTRSKNYGNVALAGRQGPEGRRVRLQLPCGSHPSDRISVRAWRRRQRETRVDDGTSLRWAGFYHSTAAIPIILEHGGDPSLKNSTARHRWN